MTVRATPPPAEVHRHPMRIVTRRTGLSADLLRVWERRYSVVQPVRSKTGRRIYSDADIERLRLLRHATHAGRSIGQVAGLSTTELADLARGDARAEEQQHGTRSSPAAGPETGEMLDEALRAVERFDALGLDALLRRASVALPSMTLLEALVVPLLARLGTRWQEGTLRPAHEHLAAAIVRRLLDRITEAATPPTAAPTLIAATPPGAHHELGAMLVCAAAAAEGWRPTYLGVSLPADDIAEAATATRARGIMLSIVYPPNDPGIAHELRRLGALLPRGTALLVGGAASAGYAAVLGEIGADHLTDLAALQSRLRSLRRTRPRAR